MRSRTKKPPGKSLNGREHGLLAKLASTFVFGTPREMNQVDIDRVVQQFVECSQLAAEAGFHGVQIHAAHGYLLTQFLSAETNHRTDEYGGSPEKRAKIVIDIIHAVRAAAPEGFCVGIKLNFVNHQSPEAMEVCITQLKMIIGAGVDFVEISGILRGCYGIAISFLLFGIYNLMGKSSS